MPRIVLAEDDADQRTLVSSALRERGYDVVEEPDGGRLLVRVASLYEPNAIAIDLIISDVRMPVCTGLDILTGIRSARWATPVILMTAFANDVVRSRARRLGAVILDKPFPLAALEGHVERMLTWSGSSRIEE